MGDEKHTCARIRQFPKMFHYPFCKLHLQTGRRLIGDHQPGCFHLGRRNQNTAVHTAGKLKGIEISHAFIQGISFQNPTHFIFGGLILFSFSNLRTDLHKRVQKSDALGHQYNLPAPQLVRTLLCQLFSQIINMTALTGVIRQNPKDCMGQQAFSGTAGTDNCHDLTFPDAHIQITNHVQIGLCHTFLILFKRNGQVFYI